MKTNLEVEILNIEIDDFYYSFKYRIKRNGKLVMHGAYENDHVYKNNQEELKKSLKEDGAVKDALMHYQFSISFNPILE
jgi:hypothetical protein